MSEIIVLTDGQCRFCKASMDWVAKKLEVEALAYQKTIEPALSVVRMDE